MDKTRIAVLGAAHEGAGTWVKSLTDLEEVEVGPLWDPDPERGQRMAAAWNLNFQPDLAKTLAERNVTCVLVASETSRRAELIAQAAAAGKHVFSAAPLAISLEQCDRLLSPIQKNGAGVMPCFPLRFDPLTQRVRTMIWGGKLGKVDMLRMRLGSHQAISPGFAKAWQANAELSGGGVFMDHGIHAADYVQWLLGPPLDVVAQWGSSQTALPVEDNIIAVYRFPRNIIAEVACSWVCLAATSTIEAYGEAGTIVVQGNDPASRDFTHDEFPRIYCNDFQERRWQPVETASNFRSEMFEGRAVKAFAEFVLGRAPLPLSWTETRHALVMVLAAYAAAREGRRMVFTTGERGLGFRPE
jgi:predicted dehydrogenase